jgi:signal recognition particle GTPase
MLALFGDAQGGLPPTAAGAVILLLGLQGAGKTTTAGQVWRG